MDAQEHQDPEKVSTIWVKNLKKIVNKMNNTKSSMTGMKPKDAIKLDTIPLNKTYPKETVLPRMDYIDTLSAWQKTWRTKKMGNRPYLE